MQGKEVRIGNVKLNNPFLLAPLAGITDAPMRKLCQEQGASATFSEMVSGKGLWYGDKNTSKILYSYEDEDVLAFQVFGSEPDIMAFTAKKLEDYPNRILDFNIGCPVPKIVKNGEGSALLKKPQLVYDLVKALVDNTAKPVTAKIRIGWDENSINCVEIAKAIESAGASALCVHGRTREQFYSGIANWEEIANVKKAISIPVIGNGDVTSWEDAKRMFETTGCDMIMVGRAALGNPWIFRELCAGYNGDEIPKEVTIEEKKAMMKRHIQMVVDLKGEYGGVREMRKHVSWYIKGLHGSAQMRGKINKIEKMDELLEAIDNL